MQHRHDERTKKKKKKDVAANDGINVKRKNQQHNTFHSNFQKYIIESD